MRFSGMPVASLTMAATSSAVTVRVSWTACASAAPVLELGLDLGQLRLVGRHHLPLLLLEGLRLAVEQLLPAAVERLHGRRLAGVTHALRGPRLVEEVDGLVGQRPVGQIALRELDGGPDGGLGELHLVVLLVAPLQAAQDADGSLDVRSLHLDRLEPPLERLVAFDVLFVLLECRRADTLELAAGERRLEHVRGIEAAARAAGADDGVQLVDEEDHRAMGRGDLLLDRFQPLLELALHLGAGQEAADVQRQDAAVPEVLRHGAVDDALGQALDDHRLADARLADQDGVVLLATREDLDQAVGLAVPADDRVQLAAPGLGRDVDREAVEGAPAGLGVLLVDLAFGLDAAQGVGAVAVAQTYRGEHRPRPRHALVEAGEEQRPGRDIGVAQPGPLAVGQLEELDDVLGDAEVGHLHGLEVRQLLGVAADHIDQILTDPIGVQPQLREDLERHRVFLLEQRGEDELGRDHALAEVGGLEHRGLDGLANFGRRALHILLRHG
jgi:hypothetical protein